MSPHLFEALHVQGDSLTSQALPDMSAKSCLRAFDHGEPHYVPYESFGG